jgi:hypothetical protein
MAEKVEEGTENSEQDLALLNDDNAIRVIVNGSDKYLAKDWLEGDGRATGSVLAKLVLGTVEGFCGSTELEIEDDFVPVFDMLRLWLLLGNEQLQSTLTEENASALYGLATYFGIEKLEQAIKEEQERREQAIRDAEAEQERATVLIWKSKLIKHLGTTPALALLVEAVLNNNGGSLE